MDMYDLPSTDDQQLPNSSPLAIAPFKTISRPGRPVRGVTAGPVPLLEARRDAAMRIHASHCALQALGREFELSEQQVSAGSMLSRVVRIMIERNRESGT